MGCYDQIKGMVKGLGLEGITAQFTAAFGAGLFMTCTVAPFDKIRPRLMNQPPGERLYNNFFDCGLSIVREEGPLGLWRGFIPIWSRFAPTTCMQLLIFEQLSKLLGIG